MDMARFVMEEIKPKKVKKKKAIDNPVKKSKGHRFEKGNKHAVGNSGPPPTTDYEAMAKALEAWAIKDTSSHLAEFAIEQKVSSVRFHDWRKKSIVFAEALIQAKDQLNIRVREKLNDPEKSYNERLAMRDISNYDTLLKIEERGDKEFESKLKRKEEEVKALTLVELKKFSQDGELSQK